MQRAPRGSTCGLPMRHAVRRAAATLRVSSFAACRALALVFAARFAMPRGVGVRPRRGSCRGRHPVRCRMLLGAAGIRPQRRALRLCVCLRLRHAVRLHSCSQPGLRHPVVWACGCEEARAEVGILSAAGCCSVRRGCGRRGVRCDFACVFVCGMPCACTRVRSPVCDTPRCGRAAAKRLVPRSASCPLPDAARCGGDTAAEAGFGGCGVRRGTLFARLAGGAAVPANGGGEDGGVPCNVRESALRIGIRLLGPEENAARAGAGICGIGTHAGIRL